MHIAKIDKANIIDILFIILGSFLGSIGVNMFLIHASLLSGGVTGVALILQYLFKVQAGYIVLILNIPLFLLWLANRCRGRWTSIIINIIINEKSVQRDMMSLDAPGEAKKHISSVKGKHCFKKFLLKVIG